jgi:DNA-binding NarL/FixJ family response regulator
MSAGLTGYLRKPLAPDEIVSNVRAILETVRYSPGGVDRPFNPSLVG